MRDYSAEILFQSLQEREAIESSSGVGRDVHSLTLSIQYFLCLYTAITVKVTIKSKIRSHTSIGSSSHKPLELLWQCYAPVCPQEPELVALFSQKDQYIFATIQLSRSKSSISVQYQIVRSWFVALRAPDERESPVPCIQSKIQKVYSANSPSEHFR